MSHRPSSPRVRRCTPLLLLLAACLLVLLAAAGAATAGKPYSHVYVFGDSYSDNGRSLALSTHLMESTDPPAGGYVLAGPPAYWQGRWSNGPTAVEVLARRLRVGLTDYAVGGAESSYSSYYSWLDPYVNTGLLGQVATFRHQLSRRTADPHALYVVQMAGNDFFYWKDYALTMPGDARTVGLQVVANECEAVRRLSLLGARKFLVVGSENLAELPWVIANSQTGDAAAYTRAVNGSLPGALRRLGRQLGVTARFFSLADAWNVIRDNAADLGILELDAPWELTYPAYVPGTDAADTHFFFDEWHPTRVVHRYTAFLMLVSLRRMTYVLPQHAGPLGSPPTPAQVTQPAGR
jgi:cholinesterase